MSILSTLIAAVFWAVLIQMSWLRTGFTDVTFRGLPRAMSGKVSIAMTSVTFIVRAVSIQMIIGVATSTFLVREGCTGSGSASNSSPGVGFCVCQDRKS